MSWGSTDGPVMWITSKAWARRTKLRKSSRVPDRLPRAVSIAYGGPPTGMNCVFRPPISRVPAAPVKVNCGGDVAMAASTSSGPKRTWCPETSAPARARNRRAPSWLT